MNLVRPSSAITSRFLRPSLGAAAASEAGLHPAHVETRYQWVTHAKLWRINLIAYKNPDVGPALGKRPLTTRAQMGKLNYYLPYAANPRVVKKVLRKVIGC